MTAFGDSEPPLIKLSPYFSLADPSLIVPFPKDPQLTSTACQKANASNKTTFPRTFKTITELLGDARNMTDTSKAQFLLLLLKHNMDFDATAKDLNVKSGKAV